MPPGRSRPAAAALAAIVLALAPACGGDDTVNGPPPSAPGSLSVTSAAFAGGTTIPARFTCSGDDVSPPLRWTGVPSGARSLALLMEDPDAPGGTFVHWTLYDLGPSTKALHEGDAPSGARQGENSFGHTRYDGPCPPKGDKPHRYDFILYALREPLGVGAGAKPEDVRKAIEGRALARGQLVGRFGR